MAPYKAEALRLAIDQTDTRLQRPGALFDAVSTDHGNTRTISNPAIRNSNLALNVEL